MDASHAANGVAALIVHSGRHKGARRPLTDALTIIGAAEGATYASMPTRSGRFIA